MIKRFALTILVILGGVALPLSASSASAQTGGSLANTSWVLAETAVQRAAFVPALGNPPPTLVFSNDGKISGSTVCNSYGGTYTQDGNQLNISEVISTLRACVDDSLNKQEQLMLSVLKGQAAFTLSGDKLSLSTPAGALNFVPASGSGGAGGVPGVPATGNPAPETPASGLPFLLLALTLVTTLTGFLFVYTRRRARPAKQ
jgi:heat shock protein HslJ